MSAAMRVFGRVMNVSNLAMNVLSMMMKLSNLTMKGLIKWSWTYATAIRISGVTVKVSDVVMRALVAMS